MICHQCGTDIQLLRIPSRLDTCPDCRAHVHCCLNCRFYDPTLSNSCQEPQADYVSDKAAANFCEFFQPGTKTVARQRERAVKDAKKAFDDLFKF
jgi:hypothetical protein